MTSQPVDPSTRQPLPPSAYLMLTVASTSIVGVLWSVGFQHSIATGMLVAAAAAGLICWLVRAGEVRTRRAVAAESAKVRAEVLAEVRELRSAIQKAYQAPHLRPAATGRAYMSLAAGGEADPVPPGVGLDPEAIASARTIARHLLYGQPDQRSDQN